MFADVGRGRGSEGQFEGGRETSVLHVLQLQRQPQWPEVHHPRRELLLHQVLRGALRQHLRSLRTQDRNRLKG